jgi:hypothetical protein
MVKVMQSFSAKHGFGLHTFWATFSRTHLVALIPADFCFVGRTKKHRIFSKQWFSDVGQGQRDQKCCSKMTINYKNTQNFVRLCSLSFFKI